MPPLVLEEDLILSVKTSMMLATSKIPVCVVLDSGAFLIALHRSYASIASVDSIAPVKRYFLGLF